MYIYILLLLKLIIQHNFTQFKKFLFKYLYKYFEKDWTAANMPIFFLILSQLFMYSLINITWLSHDILW